MATTDKESSAPGTDNHPPMLKESDFDSWKIWIQSQGLPRHIFYALNQTETSQEIWENVELLMQGSGLTEQQQKKILFDRYERAPGNKGKQIATGSQGKLVTYYNCRGQGHITRECKEKKREKDSQWFKDKALLMEAKEKGVILDVEGEAFLADVECTAHYDDSLAITTTTAFEVSHDDAYDSDVYETPHAAAAFMANMTGTFTREGTSNDTDFHSEVSHVLSDQISMITILDDMRLKLEGYMNTNKEQSLANDSLKAELERYKTHVQYLEQCKVKRDLKHLVTKRNKQNADLEEQIVSLKQLSQQVESNKSLKTESENLKNDNKAREDSYQEELVWLRHANKVVTELLQSYGQSVQIVPILSKRPTFASLTQNCSRVHDNEDTLVHAEVSRAKMLERMKDPECPIISSPINSAKLNNLKNSSVSSGATIPMKPKAVAFGLYAMTPKYVLPQKRINRETNSSLPRKETVTVVNLSNVPVNLPIRIKLVPHASKSKSKSDKKTHKNLPARSKKVKRVAKPLKFE
nr:hypothetical protein [Tanacetum cinerariifolium]